MSEGVYPYRILDPYLDGIVVAVGWCVEYTSQETTEQPREDSCCPMIKSIHTPYIDMDILATTSSRRRRQANTENSIYCTYLLPREGEIILNELSQSLLILW